jgi:hypothetical protein
MTAPLVYVFAAAAVLLFVGFLLSAWLAFRHARHRGRYAKELTAYVAESGARFRDEKHAESLAAERERVMHITIGDLVRDPALTGAATSGIVARREAARRDAAPRDGTDSQATEPSP